MPKVSKRWPLAHLSDVLSPRNDLVLEDVDAGQSGTEPDDSPTTTFVQLEGPFRSYERRVEVGAEAIFEVTTYRLAIPWFGWLYAWPVLRTVGKDPGPTRREPKQPWWAPPDRLDERAARVVGLLAAAAMLVGFVNTLFTQTVSFAADEFGFGERAQGVAGTVVRFGIVLALPLLFAADRLGRRRIVTIVSFGAIACSVLGAVAPSFEFLTGSQTIGRPLGLALEVLVSVIAAEEMPRNSRAYAISVLAMASGLGAGLAVMALPLADVGLRGWRLVYLVAAVLVVIAIDLTRRLPESKRFERVHAIDPPISRRRFAIIASVAFFTNLFVAPASFFQNRYLDDVRGYSASLISLFTLSTATPAGIGLIVGGRIADVRGRRIVAGGALIGGTFFLALSFRTSGWFMWVAAFLGGTIAGAGYPAIAVYRTELFPTGNRSRVGGLVTASALLSGGIGLLVTGYAVDSGVSYGTIMALLSIGVAIAAIIVFVTYPETAHTELETLNPEDAIGVTGADERSP